MAVCHINFIFGGNAKVFDSFFFFLSKSFVFLLLSFKNFLYILGNNPLSVVYFFKQFLSMAFYFLNSIFHREEMFKVKFINYFPNGLCFWCCIKIVMTKINVISFSFQLFSRSFRILYFLFRSVLYFELIFMKGLRTMFRCFACRYLVVSALFVEQTCSMPLYHLFFFFCSKISCLYLCTSISGH